MSTKYTTVCDGCGGPTTDRRSAMVGVYSNKNTVWGFHPDGDACSLACAQRIVARKWCAEMGL